MLSGLHYNYVTIAKGGSVYPIKQGKQTMGLAFYYKVGEADKKRKVVTGNSENELREKAIAFLEQIDKECEVAVMATKVALEEISKPRVLTFREVGDEWFAEYKEKRHDKKKPISYSSVESRQCSLKRINEVIGDMLIADITQDVAEDTIDKCSIKKDGTYYSKSHVAKLEQVLQLVIKYGRKKGYCSQELERIELDEQLTEPNPDDRFLDKEQIKIIRNIVENNPRYKIVLEVLSKTGMRQEELFALETTDFTVQKDNRVALIINKTVVGEERYQYNQVPRVKSNNSRRRIYIAYELYEKIMEYHKSIIDNESNIDKYNRKVNGTEKAIFVNQDKRYINKRTFARNFKDYLKRNGGADMNFNVTLHMLRHSYASHMAEITTAEKVAKVLGDSRETVYKNYFSLTEKDKNDIAEGSSGIYEDIF